MRPQSGRHPHEAVVLMLDLKEVGAVQRRLVDRKATHERERSRAFKRSDEGRLFVHEMRRRGKSLHLRLRQEPTARMGIGGAAEADGAAQHAPG